MAACTCTISNAASSAESGSAAKHLCVVAFRIYREPVDDGEPEVEYERVDGGDVDALQGVALARRIRAKEIQ